MSDGRCLQALAFASLLLLIGFAGCAGKPNEPPATTPSDPAHAFDPSTLSQPAFEILPAEEVWVTTSDGKRINNALYRPDTDEPVPVFINFSPYWGDSALDNGDAFSRYMIEEYVPRGYAVVLAAVRGTGHSEGCFEVGSDRESLDLNEVVDFFSKADWSNGNVAAGGKSYDSTSQNGMVAKFPHAALKGIFHVSGITDMYTYTFQKGVPARADSAIFTWEYGATQGASEYAGGAGGAGSTDDEDPESLSRIIDDAACVQLPQHVGNAGGSTAAGAKTPYWVERDWTRSIRESSWNGSIFFVHGLQDWNVQPSHILPWLDEVNANGNIRVLAWLHQWQQGATGHVYPMRTDWNETMLRWLDHTLKGKDTFMDDLWGFEIQDMNEGAWRRLPSWPLPSDVPVVGSFSDGSGTLSVGDEERHVSGGPWAEVKATVTNPDAVLSLRLSNTDGWVTEGVLRAVYRNGLETPAPIVPGTQYTFRVDFYPIDLHLAAGATLTVTSGAEPSRSVVLASQLDGVQYDEVVVHLPDATAATLVAPQPEKMICFTC